MTEMRKDIFSERWVIINTAATVEPSEFRFQPFTRVATFCPFCEHHEASTPPEVFAIRSEGSGSNGPGWRVRVVPNAHPRLRIEGQLDRRAEGFHDLMNGVGAHEVIVETPSHDLSLHELDVPQIADVIRACVTRIQELRKDPRVRYSLVFKNHGEQAGAHTVSHSISQLMALPITPRAIRQKLIVAKDYYRAKERCIYCDVMRQELNDKKRLVCENDRFVAFTPFASRFPFEMTVMPKQHGHDLVQISEPAIGDLASILREVLRRLEATVAGCPYNLSLQNCPKLRPREGYWTTVEHDFHWHLEILPQVIPIAGFEWGSGSFYNPVAPEVAAKCLVG